MKKRAIFLDRDGTINKDVGYPNCFDLIEIYPCSFEAVQKINRGGLLAVIATNQSGVGRGLIQEENLSEIHQKLIASFLNHNAYFDGIYYCPHYLESAIPKYRLDCLCRKPYPGMGLQAAADLNIDTTQSYMVGDKLEDLQFGLNIKARSVLVLTGYGQKTLEEVKKGGVEPAHVAANLLDAVTWILDQTAGNKNGHSS